MATDIDATKALLQVIDREAGNPNRVNVFDAARNLMLERHDEPDIDAAFTALRVGLAFNLRQVNGGR